MLLLLLELVLEQSSMVISKIGLLLYNMQKCHNLGYYTVVSKVESESVNWNF